MNIESNEESCVPALRRKNIVRLQTYGILIMIEDFLFAVEGVILITTHDIEENREAKLPFP